MFEVVNVLLNLAKKRKAIGYGNSIIKTMENLHCFILKFKGVLIMICAAIWGGGHTEIYLTNRDSESTQGGKGERGYSEYSYLKAMKDYLPAIWKHGMRFLQGNAPINTANIIKKLFQSE